MTSQKKHAARGYALGALAAATYGTNPLFALPLYRQGMSVDSVLFYRYAIAIIILAAMMKFKGERFAITRSELPALAIAGILVALSSLLLFDSYNYMDVGIASTILFVYPVFVALLMGAFFHERINIVTVLSIGLALVGIAMLYQGDGTETISTLGITLVILSSLSYALYMVAVNKSRLSRMSSMKLTFYALVFGSLIFVVRLDFLTSLDAVPSPLAWTCITAIGIFPTIVSFMAMAVAIHDIGSTPTAILGALEPVTAVIVGVAIFGETLSSRSISGILLVLVAVTLIVVARPLMGILRHIRLHR